MHKITCSMGALAAGLLALGIGTIAPAHSAGMAVAPAASISSPSMAGNVHLVGGRHWRGGPPPGRHWHRSYKRDRGSAAALGAAGAIIGLSALAAANAQAYAQPYPYPQPYFYGGRVYAPYDNGYAVEEAPYEPDDGYAYSAPSYEPDVYGNNQPETGEPYAPPPPPVASQRPPAQQNFSATAMAGTTTVSPQPWTQAWFDYCTGKYRSFNPQTGYFTAYSGEQKFCR